MAESKNSLYTRVDRKKTGRAKEKPSPNLRKVDKMTDELFEVYKNNFTRQQASASRLRDELQNYIASMKDLQTANKGLTECLADVHEPEWPNHKQILVKAAALDHIWKDLFHKLNDQVTVPLSAYLSRFTEIRAKIDKRGRKLVDYDCSRHAVELLQRGTGKKDDMKILKAREQMEETKRLYDVMNKELHEELQALYDSRIPFLKSTLQKVFEAETIFHSEYSKIHAQLTELIDSFTVEEQKVSNHTRASYSSEGNSRGKDGISPDGLRMSFSSLNSRASDPGSSRKSEDTSANSNGKEETRPKRHAAQRAQTFLWEQTSYLYNKEQSDFKKAIRASLSEAKRNSSDYDKASSDAYENKSTLSTCSDATSISNKISNSSGLKKSDIKSKEVKNSSNEKRGQKCSSIASSSSRSIESTSMTNSGKTSKVRPVKRKLSYSNSPNSSNYDIPSSSNNKPTESLEKVKAKPVNNSNNKSSFVMKRKSDGKSDLPADDKKRSKKSDTYNELSNGNRDESLDKVCRAIIESECKSSRKGKIPAQRKFASGSVNNTPSSTPSRSKSKNISRVAELFAMHRPTTEDFLTFLCFWKTKLLPPHLDLFALNGISNESKDFSEPES